MGLLCFAYYSFDLCGMRCVSACHIKHLIMAAAMPHNWKFTKKRNTNKAFKLSYLPCKSCINYDKSTDECDCEWSVITLLQQKYLNRTIKWRRNKIDKYYTYVWVCDVENGVIQRNDVRKSGRQLRAQPTSL